MAHSASGHAGKSLSHRMQSSNGHKNEGRTCTTDRKGTTKDTSISIDTSSSDDDDEPIRAPLQLKIEFVNSIMFRQWAVAKKLCHFMLMYEPNNSEAKQYAPLIDYMLNKEESSSSSDDDDSTDDDNDNDDDDGSDSDTSSEASSDDDDDDEEKRNGSGHVRSMKSFHGSSSYHRC